MDFFESCSLFEEMLLLILTSSSVLNISKETPIFIILIFIKLPSFASKLLFLLIFITKEEILPPIDILGFFLFICLCISFISF